MRLSLLTLLSLSTLSLSSPLALRTPSTPEQTLTTLLVEVKHYTTSLNATASTLCSTSTPAEKSTAQISAQRDIYSITTAITTAKGSLTPYYGQQPTSDDDAGPVAGLLKELLDEVNGTVSRLEDLLGLDALGDAIAPLSDALDGFVVDLGGVVDGLLGTVGNLLRGVGGALGGLLKGLNDGLSGE